MGKLLTRLPTSEEVLQQEDKDKEEYLRLQQEKVRLLKELPVSSNRSGEENSKLKQIYNRMRTLLTRLPASEEVFQQEKQHLLEKHPAGQGGRLRRKRYSNITSMNGGESGRTLSGAESDDQLSKGKQGDDSTLLQTTKVQ